MSIQLHPVWRLGIFLAIIGGLSLDCPAQESSATVAGTGSATIKRPASKLRMSMLLSAKAKTLEEALAALKDRREAVAVNLKKLNAEQAATTFGATSLAAEGRERSEVERMMRMQLARGGRAPKGLELPSSVAVTCTLTAEWPLKYQTQDELLIVSKQLQDRIEEADLAGLKEPKQLSPEEQELEEELASAERESNPYGEAEAKPGEPSFLFVAAITEEERAAALAEAFAKAKAQATRVAKAAGLQLGSLVEITGQTLADVAADTDPYAAYRMSRLSATDGEANENEATSPLPGVVNAVATVQAKFRAK